MGGFDLGAAASAGVSIARSMGLGIRLDPAVAFKFMVEIEGLFVAGFTEVSGLESRIDLENIPSGGQNGYTEQRAKGMIYPKLVLKRGLTTADMLWMWHADTVA